MKRLLFACMMLCAFTSQLHAQTESPEQLAKIAERKEKSTWQLNLTAEQANQLESMLHVCVVNQNKVDSTEKDPAIAASKKQYIKLKFQEDFSKFLTPTQLEVFKEGVKKEQEFRAQNGMAAPTPIPLEDKPIQVEKNKKKTKKHKKDHQKP